jgi:hypothetical protein
VKLKLLNQVFSVSMYSEENLINLDTMLTTSSLIESKLNDLSEIVAQAVNETEFKANQQPLWYTNAMKTVID